MLRPYIRRFLLLNRRQVRYLVQLGSQVVALLLDAQLHFHLGHERPIETEHNAQLVVGLMGQAERVDCDHVHMVEVTLELLHQHHQCLSEVSIAERAAAESLENLTQLVRVDLRLRLGLDYSEVELAPLLQIHAFRGPLRYLAADRVRHLQSIYKLTEIVVEELQVVLGGLSFGVSRKLLMFDREHGLLARLRQPVHLFRRYTVDVQNW